jgi:hypothetical protein
MTRPKTDDIKWSAIRQSRRHRCRTDGWFFLIAIEAIVAQMQQFGLTGRYESCCPAHNMQNGNAHQARVARNSLQDAANSLEASYN